LHFNLLRKKDPTFIDIYASSISFTDTSPSPEDALIMNENYQRFLNSINQLRPNYREVIVLRERGLSFDEIVSITGDSYSNVRTKLSRARGILTCHLQKQC
jgi:RNA polymerase sigma-70 factor (ECF subfamily)